jgi:FAD:protein FMN transferase
MTPRRRQRPLLGTFVEIAACAEPSLADPAITRAFAGIENIHRLASFQDRESALSRLNLSGGEAVAVDPVLVRVLRLAAAMMRASVGLFDCTLAGALVRRGVLPDHGARIVRDGGTADDIEFLGAEVRLRNNIQVTLDGIAKGFAVDLAVRALKQHGVKAGWINAGGDMRAFGDVAVPVLLRMSNDRLVSAGDLCNAAIATSSVAARQDPRFPGTIVSMAGRVPEIRTFSIVAAHAWRADALTKVAALTPRAERAPLIRRLNGMLVQPKFQTSDDRLPEMVL